MSVLVKALDGGREVARDHARQLPAGIAGDVVIYCLPEDWRTPDARALAARLSDDDASLLLSWLASNWWQGYELGHMHGGTGEDLREAMKG